MFRYFQPSEEAICFLVVCQLILRVLLKFNESFQSIKINEL